jgi:hypothetical protein
MAAVERPLLPPEKIKSKSYPSEADLRRLGEEMNAAHISEDSKILLARLAVLRPEARLAHNLSILLILMRNSPVYNILTEGLSAREHATLVELDLHVLSLAARETAHGLLNVHERWCAAKELRRLFKQAATSNGGFLSPMEGIDVEKGDSQSSDR